VLRRTALAMALSYLVVIFLVFGVPLISIISGLVTASQNAQYSRMGPFSSGVIGSSVSSASLHGKTVLYGAPLPLYASASPLTALGFALPGGSTFGYGGGSMLVGDMLRMAVGGGRFMSAPVGTGVAPRVAYIVQSDPASTGNVEVVETWSPWVHYVVLGILVILFSLLVSALALAPIKPWSSRRVRQRTRALEEASAT
jgi:hypothetical protein